MKAVAALVVATVIVGCGAIEALTQFDLDFQADGYLVGTLQPKAPPAFPNPGSTLSQTMANNNTKDFKSMKLSAGTISMSPADAAMNMPRITSFKVEIGAENLPTVTIAHQEAAEFAKGAYSVPLILDDVELKPYFKAPNITFTATPTVSSKPAGNIPLKVALKAHVQVL